MYDLERKRVERLAAKRMLLKQLRQAGRAWSDGQTIHRGEQLEDLRHDTLMEIMKLKEKDLAVRKGPEMARNCSNLRPLMKPRKHFDEQKTIGRSLGETTSEWFERVLRDFNTGGQSSTQDRILTMRRLLRRSDRQAWDLLPDRVRCGDKEITNLLASRRKHTWKISEEIRIGKGINITAGTRAYPIEGGFCIDTLSDLHVFDPCMVRKVSSKSSQANDHDQDDVTSEVELT